MAELYHLWPDLEIDGTPLSAEGESQLEQVIVDHHQHLPSMFAITFRDPYRDMISTLNVNIGSTITIKVTPPGGSPATTMRMSRAGTPAASSAAT